MLSLTATYPEDRQVQLLPPGRTCLPAEQGTLAAAI